MAEPQDNQLILDALGQVEHPAIALSLVDLGIVKDPQVSPDGKVSLTLALPFEAVPDNIRDYMVNSLAAAAQSAGGELVNVTVTLMTEAEIQQFLVKEQQNWRG